MKRVAIFIFFAVTMATSALSQSIYNPKADAKAEIQKAVTKASTEGKHVLIQIGGNWCPWCIKLHNFFDTNVDIKKAIDKNYVFILVNYSKENKNNEVMKQLEFPNRFGYPVLVVLDGKGKRIHTQATDLLEQDKSYSNEKVLRFLNLWNPAAINPANY